MWDFFFLSVSYSSTSSTSTEGGLVLSVASLNNSSNGSKRPNSGNNNTTTNSSSSSSSTAICSSEISNLRTELDNCKVILKTKDEEINKLNKIRDELESEVQELTASLFEEAHKMVLVTTTTYFLWPNSPAPNVFFIKLYCFYSEFNETWWSSSINRVLQHHQVLSNSDGKTKYVVLYTKHFYRRSIY